jgi:hypothetical protein
MLCLYGDQRSSALFTVNQFTVGKLYSWFSIIFKQAGGFTDGLLKRSAEQKWTQHNSKHLHYEKDLHTPLECLTHTFQFWQGSNPIYAVLRINQCSNTPNRQILRLRKLPEGFQYTHQRFKDYVRFKVLKALWTTSVYWGKTPCTQVDRHKLFVEHTVSIVRAEVTMVGSEEIHTGSEEEETTGNGHVSPKLRYLTCKSTRRQNPEEHHRHFTDYIEI